MSHAPVEGEDGVPFKAPAPKPMSVNISGDSWSQKGHGLMLPPKPRLPPSAPAPASATAPIALVADELAPVISEPVPETPIAPSDVAAEAKQGPAVDLKYTVPIWSPKTVLYPWSFEVIGRGKALGVQRLDEKGFYLAGRLLVCDIDLEHPSVSRQHAIIQHRSTGQVYVFDLGSTHGTFVNKRRVNASVYVPLKNGDMVKFGESSQTFVLQGGPEEEEAKPEPKQQPVPKPSKATGDEGAASEQVKHGGAESDVFTGNMGDFKEFLKKQKNVQAKAKGKKPPKGSITKELLPELAKQGRAAFRGKATDGKKDEEEANKSESSSEDEDPLGLGLGLDGKKRKKKDKKSKKKKKDDEDEEPEDLEITKHGTVADEFYSSGEEGDDFYDRTREKGSKSSAVTLPLSVTSARSSGALTADDIRAQIKELEKRKEDALFALHEAKATAGNKASKKVDDELEAYMASVKGTIEDQREKQLAARLSELDAEHTRLNNLLTLTHSALDRALPVVPIPSLPTPAASLSSVPKQQLSDSTPSTSDEVRKPPRAAPGPTPSLASYVTQFEKEKKPSSDITPSDEVPELTPDIEARLGTVRKRAPETATDERKKKAFVEKDEEVSTWVPPQDQKGDGRTQLNAKFGY